MSPPGCTKLPSYGADGISKRDLCCEHKRDRVVGLNKRCLHRCCMKVLSYGLFDSKDAEFCARHAIRGMIRSTSSTLSSQTRGSTGLGRGQHGCTVGAMTQPAGGVGAKRKRRAYLSSPPSPSSSGARIQRACRRPARPGKPPSVAVPLKEEAAAAASAAASVCSASSGANFSPVVLLPDVELEPRVRSALTLNPKIESGSGLRYSGGCCVRNQGGSKRASWMPRNSLAVSSRVLGATGAVVGRNGGGSATQS